MMTDKEKEHYENLARYYNSKKEPCKTEMMKFKCVVEYEYPCDHKPPVKADIYLHGDMVTTREIEPLQTELEKIKAEIKELAFLYDDLSPDKELVVDLDNIEEVFNKHIKENKQ